jgi:hypothetical protein
LILKAPEEYKYVEKRQWRRDILIYRTTGQYPQKMGVISYMQKTSDKAGAFVIVLICICTRGIALSIRYARNVKRRVTISNMSVYKKLKI